MLRMAIAFLLGLSSGASRAEQQAVNAQPADGRAVYSQLCASCHGGKGEGAPNWREPNEQGDLPPPPHDATGHTWRHADAVLYEMIAEGWRDPFNKTETLTMPAFEGKLTPQQIADVIEYLKTLWAPDQRQFQMDESRNRPLPPEAKVTP